MKPTSCLAALLALAGCSSVLDPGAESGGVILTDQGSYVARYQQGEGSYRMYGFTLVARFQNTGGEPVYLERCYPDSPVPVFGVERVGGAGGANSGYDPVWACVGHDSQIVVQPGETRVDTFRIRGPNSWDGRTGTPSGSLDGSFRLVYQAGSCRDVFRCQLPRKARSSNAFQVRVDR